jgi:hypothetical protein
MMGSSVWKVPLPVTRRGRAGVVVVGTGWTTVSDVLAGGHSWSGKHHNCREIRRIKRIRRIIDRVV